MTTSRTIGRILINYNDGESVSDSEIEFVISTIRQWLVMGLDTLGPRYHFFIMDMRLTLERFEHLADRRGLDV